jgi:acyl-CoA synthetase (AMP-forming)/AMP-acid ligase II
VSDAARLPDSVQTIPEALLYWAQRTPDAPALIGSGQPDLTYGALWQRANALAAAFNRCGVDRHDRVVLLLPEGPALAIALLGTASAAIAIPLSVALTVPELGRALDGLGAAAALTSPALSGELKACLARFQISAFGVDLGGDLQAALTTCERVGVADGHERPTPDDIAIVNQTSGTPGSPKRVPRTHRILMNSGRSHRDQYGLDRRDRGLLAAPITLSLGTSTLVQSIVAGAALILPPLSDVTRFWGALLAERPTWLQASAGFLELLARFVRRNPPLSPPESLRFVRVTAAAIAPEVCDELANYLGAPILPSYSSSEAGRISMALPPPATNKPGSAGQPVQEVKIADTTGAAVDAGTYGEIWVRGPRIFSGYLDDPAVNAEVLLPDGWFRTGDTGYLDGDGFLYVTGRVDEVINRGGDKVAPVEVDAVLLAHPAVRAAAAFAVPDERLGEDIVAAVVLDNGAMASPLELRRWLLDRLSAHKVPRRIWFVDDLPCTATGKVRRGELARLWRVDHR